MADFPADIAKLDSNHNRGKVIGLKADGLHYSFRALPMAAMSPSIEAYILPD